MMDFLSNLGPGEAASLVKALLLGVFVLAFLAGSGWTIGSEMVRFLVDTAEWLGSACDRDRDRD